MTIFEPCEYCVGDVYYVESADHIGVIQITEIDLPWVKYNVLDGLDNYRRGRSVGEFMPNSIFSTWLKMKFENNSDEIDFESLASVFDEIIN